MHSFDYDMLVIGAGQGGLPAAHMAANLGARVALIESAKVGGRRSDEAGRAGDQRRHPGARRRTSAA